jgi:imidazolonepropionase-like amidohydrolase
MRHFLLIFMILISAGSTIATAESLLIRPGRVIDGVSAKPHTNWLVLVDGKKIIAAGPASNMNVPADVREIDLTNFTLLPGLIENHGHLFLHPYSETSWDDQVLKEHQSLRTVRATVHARASLFSGFTTLRDLGTEGAGYADVGLKLAIEQGIIPGPRLIITTLAIAATGSYGPKVLAPHIQSPHGAQLADGHDNLIHAVRDQIGHGADWIKVYADYRWGPKGEVRPSFSLEELKLIVETARDSGRPTAAHAASAEAIRRAVLAGVETIEHGNDATKESFELMAKHGVAYCPTLAVGEVIARNSGWDESQPDAARITKMKAVFKMALDAGVIICNGSDVGAFTPGQSAKEIELMVHYGMKPMAAIKAATSVNAKILHMENDIGTVKAGLLADLIAVEGDPIEDISSLQNIRFVMKDGTVYVSP